MPTRTDAIRQPRPHRSVRRHAAFRFRPCTGRGLSFCTSGPEAVPSPCRRSPQPRLSTDTLIFVASGSRRHTLRVPAREVSGIRRQLDAVRDISQVAGGHDSHGASVDERQSLRRLRSGARADGEWRHAVDDPVRLQRCLGLTSNGNSPVAAWSGAVDSGAGRYELPRVVHGYRQGHRIEDERSRRARVLRLPPLACLHWVHSLACSRRPDDVRDDPFESAPGDVRPVEQGEHVDEPGRWLGPAEARVCDFGRWCRQARPPLHTFID